MTGGLKGNDRRRSRGKFLVISILAHVVLIVVATYLVVQTFTPRKKNFTARPRPPPKILPGPGAPLRPANIHPHHSSRRRSAGLHLEPKVNPACGWCFTRRVSWRHARAPSTSSVSATTFFTCDSMAGWSSTPPGNRPRSSGRGPFTRGLRRSTGRAIIAPPAQCVHQGRGHPGSAGQVCEVKVLLGEVPAA